MKRIYFISVLFGLLAFSACSENYEGGIMRAAPENDENEFQQDAQGYSERALQQTLSQENSFPQEGIIKEAHMKFGVNNYNGAIRRVRNQLNRYAAMVLSENEAFRAGQVYNDLVIKVPNRNFHVLLDSLSQLAEYPDYRRV